MFILLLRQTLTHAFRKGGGAFGACAFYIVVVVLFTFALGPEGIKAHAGAAMGVALLLAAVTAMPLLFERDEEDGSLEQYRLQPVALEIVVLAKIAGQWLSVALPILLVSPLLALLSGLNETETARAMLLLLLASPSVIAIGALGAALTLGARRGGLLQALVVLPLTVPVLIFAATGGQTFLLAMLCAALPLACLIGAGLLKA